MLTTRLADRPLLPRLSLVDCPSIPPITLLLSTASTSSNDLTLVPTTRPVPSVISPSYHSLVVRTLDGPPTTPVRLPYHPILLILHSFPQQLPYHTCHIIHVSPALYPPTVCCHWRDDDI